MSSTSSPLSASSRSVIAVSILVFSSAETLSPCSSTVFFRLATKLSPWFFASIFSLILSSASLFASASLTIWSISDSDNPPDACMVIFCSLPVPLSLADTLKIPLASISNVTSIWGTPLGAGGMPSSIKLPNDLLSFASCLSPCATFILTAFWLSWAVENTWLFFVGIVVFFSITFVDTPPSVSIPSDRGVTSNSNTSLTSPANTPPWIEAPIATTSSGFTPSCGFLPKNFSTSFLTKGILVIPPTNITSLMSVDFIPASFNAVWQGASDLLIRLSTKLSNVALFNLVFKCLGPALSAVIKGILISVSTTEDNSHFAFSADSLTLCNANLSDLKSIPVSFLNTDNKWSTIALSKSSPPNDVSPFVDLTSNTPSPNSRIDTSKVPPPKS